MPPHRADISGAGAARSIRQPLDVSERQGDQISIGAPAVQTCIRGCGSRTARLSQPPARRKLPLARMVSLTCALTFPAVCHPRWRGASLVSVSHQMGHALFKPQASSEFVRPLVCLDLLLTIQQPPNISGGRPVHSCRSRPLRALAPL